MCVCVCARASVWTCGLMRGQMKEEGWWIALEWSLIYMLMCVCVCVCVCYNAVDDYFSLDQW